MVVYLVPILGQCICWVFSVRQCIGTALSEHVRQCSSGSFNVSARQYSVNVLNAYVRQVVIYSVLV